MRTFCCLWAILIAAIAARGDDKPRPLFNGKDLTNWTARDKSKADLWSVVAKAELDPKDPKKLVTSGQPADGKGLLAARLKDFQGTDLLTTEKFGDVALHVEFILPRDGNSGLFLMGLYELQVTDSFGQADDKMQEGDAGGIPFFKKPLRNGSGKPGDWQTYDVTFRAPRFDEKGKKVANARIVKAVLNGKVVQENLELPEPTGGGLEGPEAATGPLMLQGSEGAVVYRKITAEALK
jgi:hypothetical protein